jgi:hypothetical protein
MDVDEVQVLAVQPAAVGAHRHARHRFDAAAYDQVLHPACHAHGRKVHRLQPGAAKSVQRDAGHLVRPARGQRRHATDTGALLANLLDAAGDDVLDIGEVEISPP